MQNLLWKVIMEMKLVITVLCFSLSLLQSPCVSLEFQVQPSLQKDVAVNEIQLSVSTKLPRKLRFTADVTVERHGHGDGEQVSHNSKKEVAPDHMQYKKEEKVMMMMMMHGRRSSKETWQEWVEEEGRRDSSEYFTKDYSPVRRRRPIHNKSLPVAP